MPKLRWSLAILANYTFTKWIRHRYMYHGCIVIPLVQELGMICQSSCDVTEVTFKNEQEITHFPIAIAFYKNRNNSVNIGSRQNSKTDPERWELRLFRYIINFVRWQGVCPYLGVEMLVYWPLLFVMSARRGGGDFVKYRQNLHFNASLVQNKQGLWCIMYRTILLARFWGKKGLTHLLSS